VGDTPSIKSTLLTLPYIIAPLTYTQLNPIKTIAKNIKKHTIIITLIIPLMIDKIVPAIALFAFVVPFFLAIEEKIKEKMPKGIHPTKDNIPNTIENVA
jgi:hypothetical protein